MAKVHDTWSGSISGSEAIPVVSSRVWIDGCFDAMHFGHARLLLISRRIGSTVVVGLHSDEVILGVKGPQVTSFAERVLAVSACKWVAEVVPGAPYNTQLLWLDHFGAHLAVHGDDVAVDCTGQDSMAEIKMAGRYSLVKRNTGPGSVSTTGLIDRMLNPNTNHHLPLGLLTRATRAIASSTADEDINEASVMLEKLRLFSHGADGRSAITSVSEVVQEGDSLYVTEIVRGLIPSNDQRVIYVDGDFDLFTAGHISFLETVTAIERQRGGLDPFLMVGVYDDAVISGYRKAGFPIMNMVERALSLLQCRYVSAVVLSVPLNPTSAFLDLLHPIGISALYLGTVTSAHSLGSSDRYADLKGTGLLVELADHPYQDVTTDTIRQRVLDNRVAFESRQLAKVARRQTNGSAVANKLKQ